MVVRAAEIKTNKDQDVRSILSAPHRLASELLEHTPKSFITCSLLARWSRNFEKPAVIIRQYDKNPRVTA